MRINFLAVLLIFTIASAWATTYAQSITISVQKAPLKQVLTAISKQAGYKLLYYSKRLDDAHPVTISIKESNLKEALDKCFEDQPLSYEVIKKTIVVKSKPETMKEKPTGIFKKNVTGKVTDEKGKPLANVSVSIKGTEKRTITDDNGSFSIEAEEDDAKLIFSYVGYQTREQSIKGLSFVAITLKEAVGQLEELAVVSTGYQTLPKERATGSFVQINNELFNRRVSTNLLERLDGIAPGVYFNGTATFNGNATAGTLATVSNNRNVGITIRGQNSFNSGAAQPLIVVDNFPFEGDLSNINPNDIESVTILKDAAAASIWGARSGNGVIVLTTKKGAKNQKMKVEVNSNVSVISKPDLFYNQGYLNAASYIEVEKYLFDAGFFTSDINNKTSRPTVSPAVEIFAKQKAGTLSAADAAAQLDVLSKNDVRNDYDKYVYRTAVNQQYSVAIRGGGENLTYALSTGLDHNTNSLVGNTYDRLTLNSINAYSLTKSLTFTAAINYSRSKTVENNDFAFKQYSNTGAKYGYIYPYARLADDYGNSLSVDNGIRSSYLSEMEGKGFLDWHYRPLSDIANNDISTKISDLLLRFSAQYKILPQLNVELLYQNERQIIDRRNLQSQDTYYTRNLINKYTSYDPATKRISYVFPLGGILNQNNYDWNTNNLRGQLNYNQTFGKHQITSIAGYEMRQLVNEGSTRLAYGYNDQFGTSVSTLDFLNNYPVNPSGSARLPGYSTNVSGFTNRFLSYFANAGYTYDDRYTLTVSGRKDGANLFGVNTNDRITPLWSAGIGWDISKEPFYKSDFLPYLKLRSSYGFNGNVSTTGSAFLTGTYSVDPITGAPMITGTKAPNPELRWEKIKNINIGLDFALINNIFTGSIEGYYKRGFDLLQPTVLTPQTGFTSFIANAANSRSKGIDLTLQSHNLKGQVGWTSTLLLSTLTDKVLKYDPPLTANSIGSAGYVVGYPMFALFSYKWAGLDPANGNPQGYLNGVKSEEYAAIRNNFKPDSLDYSGSERPKVFGAFRNDFSFKGFNLSVNITYKLGYVFRRSTTSINYRDVLTLNQHQDYNKRWQKPGDEAITNVPSLVYPSNSDRNSFYQFSEALIEKGDHIRLQDIRLSYLFPANLFGKASIQRLQLYAYANNVGIIWRKNNLGIDPDASLYPNPGSISFGLSANF